MTRGIIASVLASTMFGAIYYVVTLMNPLTAQDIFAWRMTLTGPLVTILIVFSGDWPKVRAALRDVARRPGVILIYLINAANVAGQMWVFMWAPLHGRALEASLGYFLMPLVMVLIGRLFYREPMSRWQLAAAILAAVGVGHELWRVGTVSWLVLCIAIGFPLIFVMRRAFHTAGVGGTWIEFSLTFLLAFSLLVRSGFTHHVLTPQLGGWILMLGLISATSTLLYYGASRTLPFLLFGLLGYLEPVLLLLVALVLGETIGRGEWFTYVPIWLAVIFLILEGVRTLTRESQKSPSA